MKTFYPRFKIKFTKGDKVVNSLSTRKLQRILYRIRHFGTDFAFDKCYLRFSYAPNYHNDGFYTNVKDLEHAYRCFEEILSEYGGRK